MWNKLRSRGRRITMAWDLFGVYLLCKLVNPWVCKLWYWIIPGCETWQHDGDIVDRTVTPVLIPWMFTILSITAILGSLYGLDRFTAWWYGERK